MIENLPTNTINRIKKKLEDFMGSIDSIPDMPKIIEIDPATKENIELIENNAIISNSFKEFYNAIEGLKKALEISDSIHWYQKSASLLMQIGESNLLQSDYWAALYYFEKCFDVNLQIPYVEAIAHICHKISEIFITLGDLDEGIDCLNTTIIFLIKYNLTDNISEIYHTLGFAHFHKGMNDEAMNYYANSLELCGEDDGELVSKILGEMADIYLATGDLHGALKNHTEALELRKELGNKRHIGESISSIALIYERMGEFNLALETQDEALALFKEEKAERDIANTYSNFGNIYFKQGELDKSLDFLFKSLEFQEGIGDRLNIGKTLNFIGEIYYNKKEFTTAIDYQSRSMLAFNAIQDQINTIKPLYGLLLIGLAIHDVILQETMLGKINNLYLNFPNNKNIEIYAKMSKALLLKKSKRRKTLGQAETILDEILSSALVDHKLTIFAMQQKCDLLLDELKTTTRESEVLNEIDEILDKLKIIAENQNSYKIQVETMIIEAMLSLLRGDIDLTKDLFSRAQEISSLKKLSFLTQIILEKRELFEKDIEEWEKLSSLDISLQDKLRFSKVFGLLESTQKELFDPYANEKKETPISILVINDGGLVFFSFKFDENRDVKDHLIAAFLSAINSFSQDVFVSTGFIQSIKHSDYTISMKQYQNLSFYYIYLDEAPKALAKLDAFIDLFKNSIPNLHELARSPVLPEISVNDDQADEIRKIFI